MDEEKMVSDSDTDLEGKTEDMEEQKYCFHEFDTFRGFRRCRKCRMEIRNDLY